jgi:hypothetical protein
MTYPRQDVITALVTGLLLIVLPSCSLSINREPSSPVSPPAATSTVTAELFVYPRNGQTEAQLAADRRDCNSWAASQTGFDPSRVADPQGQPRFQRALTACLEARGYTVR